MIAGNSTLGGGQAPSPRVSPLLRRVVTWVQRSLTAAGFLCLATWGTVTVWAHVSAARNEARLERQLNSPHGCAEGTDAGGEGAPVGAPQPATGALLGRVDLPRTGVSAIVLEGDTSTVLAQAAGHVPGTAYPGDDGNVVLAGHRDSLFRGLRGVALGDVATLVTPSGARRYVVDSIELVRPDDVRVLAPSDRPTLTLVTCYPFVYVGSAPLRFVVRAVAEPSAQAPAIRIDATAVGVADPGLGLAPSPRAAAPARASGPRGSARRAAATPRPHPRAKLHWWQRLFHPGAKTQRGR